MNDHDRGAVASVLPVPSLWGLGVEPGGRHGGTGLGTLLGFEGSDSSSPVTTERPAMGVKRGWAWIL